MTWKVCPSWGLLHKFWTVDAPNFERRFIKTLWTLPRVCKLDNVGSHSRSMRRLPKAHRGLYFHGRHGHTSRLNNKNDLQNYFKNTKLWMCFPTFLALGTVAPRVKKITLQFLISYRREIQVLLICLHCWSNFLIISSLLKQFFYYILYIVYYCSWKGRAVTHVSIDVALRISTGIKISASFTMASLVEYEGRQLSKRLLFPGGLTSGFYGLTLIETLKSFQNSAE